MCRNLIFFNKKSDPKTSWGYIQNLISSQKKIKVKSLTNRTIYTKDNYIKMKRTATSPTIPPKRSRLSGIFTNILIICNINNITHIQQDSIFDGKTFTEQFNMPVFDKMVTCAQLRENPLEYKRWTKGQKKDNIHN